MTAGEGMDCFTAFINCSAYQVVDLTNTIREAALNNV